MTGSLNSDQTPSTSTGRRAAARAAAYVKTIEWFDAVYDDLVALCERAGVHGDDRALSFTVGIDNPENPDDWREALRSVSLIGLAAEVTLAPDCKLAEWPDAVELWGDLIDCLTVLGGEPCGASLIIDLDSRTVATWEPYYCPDIGPLPDTIRIVPTVEEAAAPATEDPFAALLADTDEDDENEAIDNIERILELHELEPPTAPGHEPGDCGAFDEGERDD